jgi:hypothetical protein
VGETQQYTNTQNNHAAYTQANRNQGQVGEAKQRKQGK